MNWRNSAERYGTLSIGLHWLMLALLVGVYACINLSDLFPKGSEQRGALKTWHYMLGLTVFPLAWLRLAMHLYGPVPRVEPEPPGWQRLSAKAVQVALYALMIGMPLLGWMMVSASGKPVPFFGLELPPLVGRSRSLEKILEEIHEAGGTAGYLAIGLHAAAALFHHYLMRDNTLVRMLPGRN